MLHLFFGEAFLEVSLANRAVEIRDVVFDDVQSLQLVLGEARVLHIALVHFRLGNITCINGVLEAEGSSQLVVAVLSLLPSSLLARLPLVAGENGDFPGAEFYCSLAVSTFFRRRICGVIGFLLFEAKTLLAEIQTLLAETQLKVELQACEVEAVFLLHGEFEEGVFLRAALFSVYQHYK